MKLFNRVILFILFAHLALIIYTNRALFFSRYDAEYWKDRYEHSQWKLPLSQRTIGDDGLYLYEGYQLIRGANPVDYNVEVPPLGKYLIGASIQLFGNGYIYGLIVTTATMVVYFFLASALVENHFLRIVATALFTLDPLLTSQFNRTMLDSLQLLFLLLYFLALFHASQKKSDNLIWWTVFAGVSLGFFSQTKFPIFSPLLFLVATVLIWKSRRQRTRICIFAFSAGVAYLVPYLWYFRLGHTLVDWLKIQKLIVHFYTSSHTPTLFANIFLALFTGHTYNVVSKSWESVSEWSTTWPLITLFGTITAIRLWKQKNQSLDFFPILIFLPTALLVYSLIPFWNRYLLIILPFLYLFSVMGIQTISKKLQFIIISLLLLFNVIASMQILFSTPQATAEQVVNAWSHGFFQDLYQDTTVSVGMKTSRNQFRRFGQRVYRDGEIEDATIRIKDVQWNRFLSKQNIPLTITYHTRHIGDFTETRIVPTVKEDGRWRIPWEWNFLIEGLNESRHLETTVEEARRGSIIRTAADVPGFLVWITPKEVDTKREPKMLALLESVFIERLKSTAIHHRYVGNSQPDWPVPIGIIPQSIDEATRLKVLAFSGVSLTPHLTRIKTDPLDARIGWVGNTLYRECCSLLYTTTSYDGTGGIELEKNSILKGYNGGTLIIRETNGSVARTIIDQAKQDGKDVEL